MHKYTVVNSFGQERFTGNPVAVFFACDDLDDGDMERLAAELNLSETTFVRTPRKGGTVDVKIFTPVNELDFAGHPLLGTAVALAEERDLTEMKLETRKGTFRFTVERVKERPFTAYVQMEQPSPVVSRYERARELLEALGLDESTSPVEMYDVGPRHVFVGVKDVAALGDVRPDLKRLASHPNMAALCFCPDGAGGWRLRMFSPAYGVNEDAATGSAAGPLALHLARHGRAAFSDKVRITQGVEMGRASRMDATARMDWDGPRLEAGGYGYLIAAGSYFI
jgi:trans-2,3-dihydro-3-hydroxyanthranilate isomerase